jgi:ABC-type nitrate/sulfonate/bicarbonate transport system substrate-binding protein
MSAYPYGGPVARRVRCATPGARGVAWAALLTLFFASTLGCGGEATPRAVPTRQLAPPLEPVRVLYAEASPALLPYWAAVEGGLFARNGLQVELQEGRDPQTAYGRLLRGEIEVYLTPLTPALVAQAAAGADLVLLGGTPDLAIVATRRFLSAREFILERFLRGVLEGIHALNARPELARELLARRGGPTAAPGAALPAGEGERLPRVPYLAREMLEPLIAARAAEDPRAAALDPDQLLEQTLLRRLEASGFVAALYRA